MTTSSETPTSRSDRNTTPLLSAHTDDDSLQPTPAVVDLEAELAAERDHLAASRRALARMRRQAEELFRTGAQVAGDGFSAESLGTALSRRLAELADDPDTPLFFGRLDHADGEHAGEAYHIGRRHVIDEAGSPMVIDWRAPVSTAFYRANATDPMGVGRRRRFGFVGGELTSFEDEHLAQGQELGRDSRILTAEIERPRVGPMRDIVATIQPEQDELVRAELEESICVQGAPGTGKTAVGLHRAAYLLYAYRERIRRAGVLVVGPSAAFLSYIAAVLPALGEIDVKQMTVDDLVNTVPIRATDSEEVAYVKHDLRMAEVIRRALQAHITEPEDSLVVSDGATRWRIGVEELRDIVARIRADNLPHTVGRERLQAHVVAALRRRNEARGAAPGQAWERRMARAIRGFLDAVWPAVTAPALVARLLSDQEFLWTAADGLLSEAERELLLWKRPPRSPRSARWSTADAFLIDEAAGLIERMPSYGHVVVDEAQDLSPMQCRAIARRSTHGSLTVLGDLAQGTTPWAAQRWETTLEHLGKPTARVVPLTLGFRVPAAILTLANRLLPTLDVNVPPPTSLRRDGALDLRHVSDLDAATVTAVQEALTYEGSVAVIAADADVAGLQERLGELTTEARLSVVPASQAKGLEFDHVVVVEPIRIVEAEPRGLHRLYVVLTRAVSRLTVLHARPLPAPLAA